MGFCGKRRGRSHSQKKIRHFLAKSDFYLLSLYSIAVRTKKITTLESKLEAATSSRNWGFCIYDMEEEEWRDVPDYEGLYQVSSLGRVKSFCIREVILAHSVDPYGYEKVTLCKNKVHKQFKIQILVAIAFLGHTPNGYNLVVDHINGIRADNRLSNLQIVTQRENVSVCFRKNSVNFSSKYAGVYWNKGAKKWHSQIGIKNKRRHLGFFSNEEDARAAYQKALKLYT